MTIACPEKAYEMAMDKYRDEAEGFREELESVSRQFKEYMEEMGWEGYDNPFAHASRTLKF